MNKQPAFSITILAFIILSLLCCGCNYYSDSVTAGDVTVYYKDGMDAKGAFHFADFINADFKKNDHKKATFLLAKEGSLYVVDIVVAKGMNLDEDYVKTVKQSIPPIAKHFGVDKSKIKVTLCDEEFNNLRTITDL